jgi:CubicO group peptidase (beta-lactamase class C family)
MPPLPPPPPRGAPLSAPELQAFIDGAFKEAMARDHVAGAVVAVVQNGQLLAERGYGVASLSPRRAMDPRATLVRLGSTSQIFTWIAALKAVEAGKLDLDAPVNAYLPDDLKLPDEGFAKPVLVRHLMSHTAGFEDRLFGRRYTADPARLLPLDAGLERVRPRRVRAAGLIASPSDYGAALAGAIVARREARPFDQLIETEILKPLGLSHTSFREPYPAGSGLPDPLAPRLADAIAQGFHWTGQGLAAEPFAYGQSLAPGIAASASADDMARLMIALLDNGRLGNATLYGAKAARLLATPLQAPAPGVPGSAHGLCDMRLPGGARALFVTGRAPGFVSILFLVPGQSLGVFISADTDTAGPLIDALPRAIADRTVETPGAAWAAQSGQAATYLSAMRASHGLETFIDRLTATSTLAEDGAGGFVLSDHGAVRRYGPTGDPRVFAAADGETLFTPTEAPKPPIYILGSGRGVGERVGGLHSLGALIATAGLAATGVLASVAGAVLRDRGDERRTRPQVAASATLAITCILWCAAFWCFWTVAKGGLSAERFVFAWPNGWLTAASWCALAASLLSVVMLGQLPSACREERRIHGWSAWRKVRHAATVIVFLAFAGVLAAWGALEPWSS